MADTFACPECAEAVSLSGLSPGRTVHCPSCQTLVEVPYIPRVMPSRRRQSGRWSRPRLAAWIGGGVLTLLLFLLLLVVAGDKWQRLSRQQTQKTLESRLETATAQDKAGHLAAALQEFDSLIELARAEAAPLPPHVTRHRDDLALRLGRQQLISATEAGTPGAFSLLLTLRGRVQQDPALSSLTSEVETRFQAAAAQALQFHLENAAQALQSQDAQDTLRHCRLALEVVDYLPPAAAKPQRQAITLLVNQVADLFGLALEPIQGSFILGSSGSYTSELTELLAPIIQARGYITRQQARPWARDWDKLAGNRLAVKVNEQPTPYLQSALSGTRIDAELLLTRQNTILWRLHGSGQTRIPPPRMSAYEAGRLASATRRDPDAHRRLYDDARAHLIEKLRNQLTGFPAPAGSPSAP